MAKPLVLPEPFSGEDRQWFDWVDHFESVAAINEWDNNNGRLLWLRVQLTGRVHADSLQGNFPSAVYGRAINTQASGTFTST